MERATERSPRRWLVTGVSSGIGQAIAEAALAKGDFVLGTVRGDARIAPFEAKAEGRAHALRWDAREPGGAALLVASALSRLGAIDVVVNNAGYGSIGAIEEVDEAEVRAQFDVNTFAPLAIVRAVLPDFRARRSGHLIMVSSMAGVRAFPGAGIYAASKHAIEAFSEALAGELEGHGVRVSVVEPGGVRTEWSGRSMRAAAPLGPYPETAARIRALHGQQATTPEEVASVVLELVDDPAPPLWRPVGPDAFRVIELALEKRLEQLRSVQRGSVAEQPTGPSLGERRALLVAEHALTSEGYAAWSGWVERTQKEAARFPGLVSFRAATPSAAPLDSDDGHPVAVVAEWRSDEALDAWRASAEHAACLAELRPFQLRAPRVTRYSVEGDPGPTR